MKQLILYTISLFITTLTYTQTTITGTVTDEKGQPVAFANIYLKDIYDGSSTDEQGVFSFLTNEEGNVVLVVSALNYETTQQPIVLQGDTVLVQLSVKEAQASLQEVVITAGAFEASDEKKATILKPLDIVTNAGAAADVYGALRTLPGVSQVGDETGIFVRGGEAYETKTIIDGMIVQKPFFSEVPNIPSRGRFDPFLFKGTLFTTGGYSAEYGQALSSVLILNTEDIPEENSSSLSLNLAGINVAHTHVWNERTALIGSVGYTYLVPLFTLVKQNQKWDTPPMGVGSSWAFRHKTDKGLFKSYLQYQDGKMALQIPNLDELGVTNQFRNTNHNLYWNNSYKGMLGENWGIYGGLSFSIDNENGRFDTNEFGTTSSLTQAKMTLSRDVGEHIFLKIGGEVLWRDEQHRYNELKGDVEDLYSAVFAEGEVSLSKKLAFRAGARGEYSDILQVGNVAPRTSLAFKTGKNSQIALAYGQFYQTPEAEFLREKTALDFEQSAHYILNYQWLTEDYTFRIEAYQKDYHQLVKENPMQRFDNSGTGFARGLDFFWRDKKTIPGLDYWLTYSYINAERNYRDYPTAATPPFVTNHTVNLVANYTFYYDRLRVGCSYAYASGRTYYNPNNETFLGDRTIDYHNLNLNGSYLTSIFGNFSVLYLSVGNPFGFEQVFSYRYSSDGSRRAAVLPGAKRSFFVGVFITL